MQRLLQSRAFHCPDATEAMAEACGAAQPLHALQVRHKTLPRPRFLLLVWSPRALIATPRRQRQRTGLGHWCLPREVCHISAD